jgi:SAM-dependent methyltransferase
MSSLQPEHAARWYEDKVRRYGFDYRGLGFRTRSSQEKRFEALLALGDFHGRRILDVGCGFGDFLAFLVERDIHPLYTGLDVCEPMIERCQQRFPAGAGRFVAGDVLDHEVDQSYDYVVASGLFGLDSPGARERIPASLARMFGWCRIGLAVNFLSARYASQVDDRIYVEPGKALEAALDLTPAVRVDHNYLPNDFTLHLYRTPSWNGEPERKP